GATAKTALKVVLEVSGGLGAGELGGIITNVLQPLDALDLLDGVLDAVAEALLSNTLTLLQATGITTQLTEVTFGDNEIRGNVIEGENGAGADTPSVGTTVTKVTFDGQDYFPDENTEEITVFGQYGTLVMSANGKYTYTLTNPDGVNETEVFTYTVEHGSQQDTANLSIEIGDFTFTDLTVTLEEDTGSIDGITSNGVVNVTGVESGATWEYRLDGGAWVTGTGSSFILNEGTYTKV